MYKTVLEISLIHTLCFLWQEMVRPFGKPAGSEIKLNELDPELAKGPGGEVRRSG